MITAIFGTGANHIPDILLLQFRQGDNRYAKAGLRQEQLCLSSPVIDRCQQACPMVLEQEDSRQFQSADFCQRPFQNLGRKSGAFRGARKQLGRQPIVDQRQTCADRGLRNRLIIETAQVHQAIGKGIVSDLLALR